MGDCTCGHRRDLHESRNGPCVNIDYDHQTYPVPSGKPVPCMCEKFTPAPSPARDDAEKAIAGLLAEHPKLRGIRNDTREFCGCGWVSEYSGSPNHVAHVASVIAAHMAEPDELTTLRQRVAELEKYTEELRDAALREDAKYMKLAHRNTELADKAMGYRAERDALRERIKALADEWGPQSDDGDVRMVIDCANAADALRATLGDA